MRIIRSVLGIFLLSTTFSGYSQANFLPALEDLQKGGTLPEELLSSRSAVFLKVDPSISMDSARWYQMAEELQQGLMAVHIDAVAYYRWRDLNAGFDASGSYLQALLDRETSQIIILEVQQVSYQIYIVPTDQEGQKLLDSDSQAWHISGTNLENAIANLTQNVSRSGLEIGNFLISEAPEFFVDTPIFRKNRFESFQPDLKLDKLAVPLFFGEDPKEPSHPADLEIQAIFKNLYPFEYQTVSAGMSEDLMKKAGFHYVLRYLNAEESTLVKLLDYQFQPDNPNKLGYKFYFKHLITGDIYLGDNWDSRSTWQEALQVHLSTMRRSLKVE